MKIGFRVWILIVVLMLALLAIKPSFESGVIVKSVEKDSLIFQEGLRAGEIIKSLNGEKIENREDYSKAVGSLFLDSAVKRIDIQTKDNDYTVFTNESLGIVADEVPSTRIKTGLDLSGGARAIIKAANLSLTANELNDLVAITESRLNAFGIADVSVRAVTDLEGNNFMLVEVAGATPGDLRELVGKQGKFEAKIMNKTVFGGGKEDIADVCRTDASCAGVRECFPVERGYACNFAFTIYLTPDAAEKHAKATGELSLDPTGKYLSENLFLYVDDIEVDSLLIGKELKGQATTQISIQGSGSGSSQEEALKDARKNMNRLQTILITGSLPYKLEIIKLDTISPSLGKEFTKGLVYLGLIVFAIVSLVIFVKYRNIKLTLAVMLTMASEAIITLGVAALIKWNLDAPGIAGIIAGIGTGVNDQIVLLDEAESGEKTSGIKERVKRALFIIMGAFLTIVAAMLPLFWAGAGLLRGFALTTIIGVTAGILITRPAFADIVKRISE